LQTQVTKWVEDAVAGVKGVKHIISYNRLVDRPRQVHPDLGDRVLHVVDGAIGVHLEAAVTVTQAGAAPSELQTQVTKWVEDAVAGVKGVKPRPSSPSTRKSTIEGIGLRIAQAETFRRIERTRSGEEGGRGGARAGSFLRDGDRVRPIYPAMPATAEAGRP
jgi:hypothetical protein